MEVESYRVDLSSSEGDGDKNEEKGSRNKVTDPWWVNGIGLLPLSRR